MPRTKGSKNRPKTTHTDYASQIAEKQEAIASLTAEIASITANIDTLKADEYSRAMKSHFRKFGNQMSGSGNHLCNYASLLA